MKIAEPAKRPLILLGVCAALWGFLPAAQAQDAYPSRPIRIIVPWPAGGTTDIVARLLGDRLTTRLGQPVVVDNRAGATGMIGAQFVQQAAPDGYTLLMMATSAHSFRPAMAKSMPFDPIDSFAPITQVVAFPLVVVVKAGSPYNSINDVVAAARKDPGKLTYGSFGSGSAPHLIAEYFALTEKVTFTHVPYKGASQAITDLVSGQFDFMFDSIPSPLGQIQGGRLKALATTGGKRAAVLPNVPTAMETIPGFTATSWLGVAAPQKTPQAVIDRLNKAIREVSEEPEYAKRIRDMGADVSLSSSPSAFRDFLVAQKQQWSRVVTQANIPLVD